MFQESMFRETLIETSHASVVQRGWATLMSFGLEMAIVSLLLVTPLFFTQVMPAFQKLPGPPAMTSIGADEIKHAINLITGGGPAVPGDDGAIHAPSGISEGTNLGPPRELSRGSVGSSSATCDGCVLVGGPVGVYDPNAAITNLLPHGDAPPVLVHAAPPKVVRLSHMAPGMLIAMVEPKYPDIARSARAQGEVVLAALIDKDGRIVNLHSLKGHVMLVPAALDAVRQWRYRPTFLNGQPVEVETQIIVNFTLQQH
jgi:periplasmic protein TonB